MSIEKELVISNYIVSEQIRACQYTDNLRNYDNIPCDLNSKDIMCSEIETGGITAYSDASISPESYKTNDNPEELALFYPILNRLIPNRSEIEQLALERLIKSDNYTNYADYYGGTTDFQINYIVINDFIRVLKRA